MSDYLRDRITVAVARELLLQARAVGEYQTRDSYKVADALIAALGLRQEWSVGDDDGGRVLWFDNEEPVTPREGEAVETRYVTDWISEVKDDG